MDTQMKGPVKGEFKGNSRGMVPIQIVIPAYWTDVDGMDDEEKMRFSRPVVFECEYSIEFLNEAARNPNFAQFMISEALLAYQLFIKGEKAYSA